MRNKFSIAKIVLFFCITVFTLYSNAFSDDTIKIGAIFSKSGSAAPVTKSGFDATRFAVDKINKNGGILGKKIILLEYDNKSNSLDAKFVAEQAVKDGVTAVIGPAFSSHAIAVAKVLQASNTPMIATIATNVNVTLVGDYIFRVCYVDTFQGRIAAEFVRNDLGADTAVVLTNSSRKYSLGLADIFIEKYSRHGNVLWQGYYQEGMTDFAYLLKKIKKLNPGTVFIPGHFRESAYIIKQAESMGIATTFIGADGWQAQMYKYGGKTIEGNYFITQWHKNIASRRNRKFVNNYLQVHGIIEEPLIALTYDAVNILARAIKKTGSLKRADIKKQLSRTKNFKGVTGEITFDKNGDPINKAAVIMKFENGKAVFQKSITP
jgi:branched-chain amino acid transport system substrate-binding protein